MVRIEKKNNKQEENNNGKQINIDIPDGYQIDTAQSDFENGKIVFKERINLADVTTFDDVVKYWDMHHGSYSQRINDLTKDIPTFALNVYRVFMLKEYFDYSEVSKRMYGNKLKKGHFIINRQCEKIVEIHVNDSVFNELAKGTLFFTSFEQAVFVDRMMRKYFDGLYEWTEI